MGRLLELNHVLSPKKFFFEKLLSPIIRIGRLDSRVDRWGAQSVWQEKRIPPELGSHLTHKIQKVLLHQNKKYVSSYTSTWTRRFRIFSLLWNGGSTHSSCHIPETVYSPFQISFQIAATFFFPLWTTSGFILAPVFHACASAMDLHLLHACAAQ